MRARLAAEADLVADASDGHEPAVDALRDARAALRRAAFRLRSRAYALDRARHSTALRD